MSEKPIPIEQRRSTEDVILERKRQQNYKGFNDKNDRELYAGNAELTDAAIAFAIAGTLGADVRFQRLEGDIAQAATDWYPSAWGVRTFSHGNRREYLVKAAALLLAQIDVIDATAGEG